MEVLRRVHHADFLAVKMELLGDWNHQKKISKPEDYYQINAAFSSQKWSPE